MSKLRRERNERYIELVESRLRKAFSVKNSDNVEELVEMFSRVFIYVYGLLPDEPPKYLFDTIKLLKNKVQRWDGKDKHKFDDLASQLTNILSSVKSGVNIENLFENINNIIKQFEL